MTTAQTIEPSGRKTPCSDACVHPTCIALRPAYVQLRETELRDLLNERAHLRARVTELLSSGTAMLEARRALAEVDREGVLPDASRFFRVMAEKLAANTHKGTWKNDSIRVLLMRLREEVDELARAIETEPPGAVAREAADVSNFAFFIADVSGGLE